jgi:adenine-specific DNA methylase
MAGHWSRWDRYYLKSYESMAGHRFNFTTFAVEPNVWGTPASGRGTVLRRIKHLIKAAEWLHRQAGERVSVQGPLPSNARIEVQTEDVRVVEGSSEKILLPDRSCDLVLTDPPYHDDVQYAELSLPLRAWAGLSGSSLIGEAVVNDATGQLADEGAYEQLLTRIFSEARRTLREDGHLIFSYANRDANAWVALFEALQKAGLRAVGCEILHSENETDSAKRGVRACTLDLIMDLVPHSERPIRQHSPNMIDSTPETDFLRRIARTFLLVGDLPAEWTDSFRRDVSQSPFLTPTSKLIKP